MTWKEWHYEFRRIHLFYSHNLMWNGVLHATGRQQIFVGSPWNDMLLVCRPSTNSNSKLKIAGDS
jgi:hypothetical protein